MDAVLQHKHDPLEFWPFVRIGTQTLPYQQPQDGQGSPFPEVHRLLWRPQPVLVDSLSHVCLDHKRIVRDTEGGESEQ
jgi:hypothetical protein